MNLQQEKKARNLAKKLVLLFHDIASEDNLVAGRALEIASERLEGLALPVSAQALRDIRKARE